MRLVADSETWDAVDASSTTPLLTIALGQLHIPDERAGDVAAPLKQRVRALPVEVLSPVGWRNLLVQTAPFEWLLRVRVEVSLLLFGARGRQIQRVLARFAAAWRRAHPGLLTFTTRPGVSMRLNDELEGDFVAIVLVVEHETSVDQENALRAELAEQILANVNYTIRVERAEPVA